MTAIADVVILNQSPASTMMTAIEFHSLAVCRAEIVDFTGYARACPVCSRCAQKRTV